MRVLLTRAKRTKKSKLVPTYAGDDVVLFRKNIPILRDPSFLSTRIASEPSAGAAVILDDYAFQGHDAQQDALDEFAAEVGVPILGLPTGQGMVIKPA